MIICFRQTPEPSDSTPSSSASDPSTILSPTSPVTTIATTTSQSPQPLTPSASPIKVEPRDQNSAPNRGDLSNTSDEPDVAGSELSHVHFNSIVNIIPNQSDDDSSDEGELESAREIFHRTRLEIEEDEQFIPSAPRELKLVIPSITRKPSRKTLRLEEEERLRRWRETPGAGKSSLKSPLSPLCRRCPTQSLKRTPTPGTQLISNGAHRSQSAISPNPNPFPFSLKTVTDTEVSEDTICNIVPEDECATSDKRAYGRSHHDIDSTLVEPWSHTILGDSTKPKSCEPVSNASQFNGSKSLSQISRPWSWILQKICSSTNSFKYSVGIGSKRLPNRFWNKRPPPGKVNLTSESEPCLLHESAQVLCPPPNSARWPITRLSMAASSVPNLLLQYNDNEDGQADGNCNFKELEERRADGLEDLVGQDSRFKLNESHVLLMKPREEEFRGRVKTKYGRRTVNLRSCCKECHTAAQLGLNPNHQIVFSPGALKHFKTKCWIIEGSMKSKLANQSANFT
ncbi:expressed protein [Phakopsora pachyrhizi]|uniref:Expressed protein n=1 Tax=Phakopsora pachyrhizi TaxID=170000 RepID=A0AAV0B3T9_PHAPC|nr:expressed protein [Phakopsora pachyrhizi]